MNILPKKSWHVRNKDNIARVRRDEEKAAEEEKERQRKIAIAESEARTDLLRKKSCSSLPSSSAKDDDALGSQKHINFFEAFEQGKRIDAKNAEHEEEKRLEKEKQEKAIGLLTYLGQGSVELDGAKPWYFEPPQKRKSETEMASAHKARDEVDPKKKRSADPMKYMDVYVDQSKKLHKLKEAKTSAPTTQKKPRREEMKPAAPKSIDELRAERLRREQAERERSRQLLAKMRGELAAPTGDDVQFDDRSRRYNSQFNPDIARRPHQFDRFDHRT